MNSTRTRKRGQSSDVTQPTTAATGEGDHRSHDLHWPTVPFPVFRELQARREAVIRQQRRLTNSARAFVRRALGWQVNLPERERTRINRAAAAAVKTIAAGEPPGDGVGEGTVAFVCATLQARQTFDAQRKAVEKQMEASAKTLPVWPWVEETAGLGALGLAIIVGECGDLAEYPGPANLWKRCGLAPRSEYAMETKDGEVAFVVPRRRRSALWTIGDSILKGKGSYRDLYDERLRYEVDTARATGLTVTAATRTTCDAWNNGRGLGPVVLRKDAEGPVRTVLHARRRAQRYVEKRLLRNLWRAWRKA